jgi:hypothetical protein
VRDLSGVPRPPQLGQLRNLAICLIRQAGYTRIAATLRTLRVALEPWRVLGRPRPIS